MPSSELKRLERELEAAAVQFTIAERASSFSDAEQSQSTSVSEARVLTAARDVLATDTTAPLDQLLDESVPHPLLDQSAGGQWRAFLGRVRRQLGSDNRPPPTDWGPLAKPGSGRLLARTGLGLLAGVLVLAIGGLILVIGGWLLNEGDCQGNECTNALQAVATTNRTPSPSSDQERSTTLLGDDGQEAPRGGISAGDPDSDAAEGEQTPDPTTDGDDDSTASTAADGASTTVTTAGATATSTGPGSTNRPAPTTTAANSATTTGATTASTPSTTTSTAAATSTPQPALGAGVECPTGTAIQRLNVTNVVDNDVLNVRLGPGTGFSIVRALAHDATGVRVYGAERNGAWVKIVLPGTPAGPPPPNSCGWVNAFFLAAAPTPV